MNTHEPNPKKFYDEEMPEKFGENYENARWGATPLQRAQYDMTTMTIRRHVLPILKNASDILEVGPGPGTWTKVMLEANPNAEYTLVDISHEMLAQASKGLAGHENVTFVGSDFLMFKSSQRFDFFFSSRAIEYMPDKRAAVKKIASLFVPNAHGAIITKMPKPFFNRLRNRSVAALHVGQIAPRELSRILEQSGCIVEKISIATATVPLIGSVALNKFVYQLLRHFPLFFPLTLFAESYCVIFRKP